MGMQKLTPEAIGAIKADKAADPTISHQALAARHGVNRSTITRILNGNYLGGEPGGPEDPQRLRAPLDRLALSPVNERQSYIADGIQELAESIRAKGLLQELVAYEDGDTYRVAEGGRRLRALQYLRDMDALPSLLADLGIPVRLVTSEREALVVSVVANLHKEEVHFLDRARAFARIRDEFGLSGAEVARQCNCAPRLVQQYLQVHDRLSDADKARAMAGELTFREARDLVQDHQPTPPLPAEPPALPFTPAEIRAAASQIGAERPAEGDSVGTRILQALAEVCGRTVTRADRLGPDLQLGRIAATMAVEKALDRRLDLYPNADMTVGELIRVAIQKMSPAPRGEAPVSAPHPTPAPAPSRPGKVPGEVGLPSEWACMAVAFRIGTIEYIRLRHRETGQTINFVPEQNDIVLACAKAAPGSI